MKVIKITNENFEKEVLEAERVLVDFNADWCGPCRVLGPILESVAKDEYKTSIASLNVDEEEDIATEYNVYSIPCLILFENGKEVKRNTGLLSKAEIKEFIGD